VGSEIFKRHWPNTGPFDVSYISMFHFAKQIFSHPYIKPFTSTNHPIFFLFLLSFNFIPTNFEPNKKIMENYFQNFSHDTHG
jgi:hypothetical protein